MTGRHIRDFAEQGEPSSEKPSDSQAEGEKRQHEGDAPTATEEIELVPGGKGYEIRGPVDPISEPSPEPDGPTVLVVDDDSGVRRSLARILRQAGCRPITTSDGEAAVELCVRMRPDLVLLDLSMPNYNGPQVIKALRTRMGEHLPRVIWITGTVTPDNLHHLGGAVACMAKPLGAPQIREIRDKYLVNDDQEE